MSHFGIAGTRSGRMVARAAVVVAVLVLSLLAQSGFAQGNGPLTFVNNFIVTGDYVVAGAYGMNTNQFNGYTTGIISVPDVNPGITGAKYIPAGAEIVGAVLYWQTVEKSSVSPGQPGSGQIGFFRPLYLGGPLTGYQITGIPLELNHTVSFSSGGCSGTSTGKLVRSYRADVRAYLPQDSKGNTLANGLFEVRLPSVGNSTPLTLGATLVLIYRILSPDVPLNAIVIYDGSFANTTSTPMTQTLQGFYQAAANPVSRLTHIASSGQSNKNQTVSLNSVQLPSLYGHAPPFPGYYGNWDNPTWTFSGNGNPVQAGVASATTVVAPTSSNAGCVAWSAVIVSTTVKDTDKDGLLDAWESAQGYCDASVNEGACSPNGPSWVALPGADPNHKDVFVQLDYMTGTNVSFDPSQFVDPLDGKSAVQKVIDAFNNKGITLHVNADPPGTNSAVHSIPEPPGCIDTTDAHGNPVLCTFPNQPGVVAWKGGYVAFKNQMIHGDGSICTDPNDTSCFQRFQHGKKDSWHYALFADALGRIRWKLQGGTLKSVVAIGNTVTFTTSAPHGLIVNSAAPNGRVTVVDAITNPSLNGTYLVKSVTTTAPYKFTIQIPKATIAAYTFTTDPNLGVAPGNLGTGSGFSDVGGEDTVITLGLWGDDGKTWQVNAGTLMHELGHGLGLTHGGFYFDRLTPNIKDYTLTVEANCKPNFQSVMNYMFQMDLLQTVDAHQVVDYSEQGLTQGQYPALNTLNEATATAANFLTNTVYPLTSWYVPFAGVGTAATAHCDGTLIPPGAPKMLRVPGVASSLSWTTGVAQDLNFDGNPTERLRPHNDWAGTSTAPGIDLRQVGATGSLSTGGGNGGFNGGGNGGFNGGGNGGFNGGGNGGFNGGGNGGFNGGGNGGFNGGGNGGFNGGGTGELDHDTANSVTRPPRNLAATEGASARFINLAWLKPTFGQIGKYNIYRASDNPPHFTLHDSVPGNQLTYQDTVGCNPTGYQYFVTAVLAGSVPDQESVPSNSVPLSTDPKLTGCYTNTPPGVNVTSLTVTGPSTVTQGDHPAITWQLQDDNDSAFVNRLAASTLTAIGPFANTSTCGSPTGTTPRTTLLTNGVVNPSYNTSTFGVSAGPNYLFTFNWDTTAFQAGCYLFELDLDSGQSQTTTSPLKVLIYISDTAPHVLTTSLPDGVVGKAYSNTMFEAGGIPAPQAPLFTWSIPVGPLPPGISLDANTGTLSGTPTNIGNFTFTAKVTDSVGNFGTQVLTMNVLDGCTRGDTTVAYNAMPFATLYAGQVAVGPGPASTDCVPKFSEGFEADADTEFGDEVALAGSARQLVSLNVNFSSYGCSVSGDWHSGNCVTNWGDSFPEEITAKIYTGDNCTTDGCIPGAVLASVTQTFAIPYRPSADAVNCAASDPAKWYNPLANGGAGACQYSVSKVLTFDFSSLNITLPNNVIWTVAFNTSHSGYSPKGEGTACYTSAVGCGYDSLNVGTNSFTGAPYAGTDLSADVAFISTVLQPLQSQTGWAPYRPLGQITTR